MSRALPALARHRALRVALQLDLRLTPIRGRLAAAVRRDRGDVNGYVFITIMTAGIVMVLWAVARDRLSEVFERAISSVTGP